MARTVGPAISRCFTALCSLSSKEAVAMRFCSLVFLSVLLAIPVASHAAPGSALPAELGEHQRVLVVDKTQARAHLYQQGTPAKSYEIRLSQVAGRKDDESRALTWGCVSMHAADLEEIFDILQLGDVVLIQP